MTVPFLHGELFDRFANLVCHTARCKAVGSFGPDECQSKKIIAARRKAIHQCARLQTNASVRLV